MRLKRVEALSVKSGPTQSGELPQGPEHAVGGEVIPMFGAEIVSVVVVALALVFGFVLLRKTGLLSSMLTRLGF